MSYRYESAQEGALGLLGLVSTVLDLLGTRYVIIGGWGPYLRSIDRPVRHPGTRDVDVLFDAGATEGELDGAIEALMSAGLTQSAKHPFQMIHLLGVGDRQLAFNVDLLHPGDRLNPAMFVKHLDLEILHSSTTVDTVHAMSMVLPNADVVVAEALWSPFEVNCVLPSGKATRVAVPLIDDVGLLLTKASSVRRQKRDRDAFDIAVTVHHTQDRSALAERCRNVGMVENREHWLAPVVAEIADPQSGRPFEARVQDQTQDQVLTAEMMDGLNQFLARCIE